ncbi:Phosphoribosylformylglycinamidine synthase subunit PurQ [Dissostichus eleginoides]|uniref:Phosphoribosylformylglycinamidine synthase subunit PurQ n=2 Tax=Dissostichus eleginoides TaxID=100907 RepID=A0AAD9BBB2_DISEL|nr:Phosphoribosylformylglycinamidine synthase subunit PurQ [Dissostichus eleginoides]
MCEKDEVKAPVTRDSNPDGPIEMENVDTRNAGPSNKPDINREIKDTNLEEPDELHDSSSDISGSGDEFDSDSSLTKSLENIFFSINSDSTPPDSGPPGAEEPCTDAMTESDGDTRYQTGRKRQSCHQMTFGDSGEKEQCSSQDTHESIVVGASHKKDGIRVYNKRHYCLYCSRPCAKMARHLEKAHEDKADVAKALSFPKRSKERRHQLDYIRNRGNYAHNAAVMESGNGELVPFKRPTQQAKGNEFIPCEYCLGLFNRKVLWRHIRTCKRKSKSVAQKPGENRVQSMCTYTGPVPAQISDAMTESDGDTRYQTGRKRQSPADSLNVPACDSTVPDQMTFGDSGEKEQCSSQDTHESIVVGASHKKDGIRVYNKRHYCLYCSRPCAKMARHLEKAHEDKADVAKALSFPKRSKERRHQLDYIRNRGNYAHNAAVMESGNGELVPFKRPTQQAKGNEFIPCKYCLGLFNRKVLWRHIRTCKRKPKSVAQKPGKNRVQSMCTYTGPVPAQISKQLWGVICSMNTDPITNIIKSDHVITDLGQDLLNKGGNSTKNQHNVREKMRELGRLIHNGRKVTSLKKLEDFINPKKYLEMVRAVKVTCGYESGTGTFQIPSLANKLGHALVNVSKLLKAHGLITNNHELVRKATEFQQVHSEKWNEMISSTALRNIAESKWNVPTLMPFTEDVQKMHQFLSAMQDECSSELSGTPSTKSWTELAKVCLTQIILFNRRREGE